MSLRYDEIAEILKIVDSSSCDELIIETGDVKIVVRRNGASAQPTTASEHPIAASAAATNPVGVLPNSATPAKVETSAGQTEVVAPMVGTFYRAPSPDAPVFVEIDSVVRVGQPLCLIEVMKLFTTINSEVAGRVAQIGAENGELVEYGRTLFVIEPV